MIRPRARNFYSDTRTPRDRARRSPEHSRSGRRTTDPHVNWRRVAWLFAAYAIYLSVRSLPSTVWSFFNSENTPTAG